ncbi:MAG: deoxyribodipyrimidine photo-lyase [Acidobacteriota bacterium]
MALNRRPSPSGGKFVLYWMQQSQRAFWNHALEYALAEADALRLPAVVLFVLTPRYPEANRRHFQFLVEGLEDTRRRLEERGVRFYVAVGEPPFVVGEFAQRAARVVCDAGYLRHQREWRRLLADRAPCPVVEVETDVVVPVRVASPKAEFAARTLRPKLQKHLERFLAPVPEREVRKPSLEWEAPAALSRRFPDRSKELSRVLDELELDASVPPVTEYFRGGTTEALRRAEVFFASLPGYAERRNRPELDGGSRLSPYLHFGQISPLYLAWEARRRTAAAPADVRVFLEELIVRRELSVNYVTYTPDYDRFDALPRWARKALHEHAGDPRPALYSPEVLEAAATADPYWNAAMQEMRLTGYMHNYMRMYWGKKILEWSADPRAAFELALRLNNRYFLDGRDPNSYAGVGWVFGLHDRPWARHPVYGTIRRMTAAGLRRKCDIEAYVRRIEHLAGFPRK